MKKRFKLGQTTIAIDFSRPTYSHDVANAALSRLDKDSRCNLYYPEFVQRQIDKRKEELNKPNHKLPKRRVCIHSRDWSWHIGWWKWLSFDWNISWIARKFGKTVNPDGLQPGVPTYNEYRGALGYHCDL